MFCYHIVLNYWSPLFKKFFNIHSGLNFILDSGLGDMVEPMVWHYLSDFRLPIGNHTLRKPQNSLCICTHLTTSQETLHSSFTCPHYRYLGQVFKSLPKHLVCKCFQRSYRSECLCHKHCLSPRQPHRVVRCHGQGGVKVQESSRLCSNWMATVGLYRHLL